MRLRHPVRIQHVLWHVLTHTNDMFSHIPMRHVRCKKTLVVQTQIWPRGLSHRCHCTTLQHTATRSIKLQHTATHCTHDYDVRSHTTNMIVSCRTCVTHAWMSNSIYINMSCHTYKWLMSNGKNLVIQTHDCFVVSCLPRGTCVCLRVCACVCVRVRACVCGVSEMGRMSRDKRMLRSSGENG